MSFSDKWDKYGWDYLWDFFAGELEYPAPPVKPFLELPVVEVYGTVDMIPTLLPQLVPGGSLDGQDASHACLPDEWVFNKFLPWFAEWRCAHGLSYTPYWDCDDYAITAWQLARCAYGKRATSGMAESVAMGWFKRDGDHHVMNFFVRPDGNVIFFDPQNGSQVFDPRPVIMVF